ncbi:MAG: DNA-binding response regulator [Betaproteobacteria bacterium]|nr:two-component system response regulator NarL [Rhodocyclaceae bacterium]MCG3186698.1 Nitrate/nitrite response regulator protein NarL [Rhodocyclaceae bacterium]
MTSADDYRVLVIDDHPLFRKGVRQLIDMDERLQWVGEASNGAEGLHRVRTQRPDLVLLDLNMRGMSGIETLSAIKQFAPDTSVVMLTVSDAPEDLVAAIRAGADGYLLKDTEPEVLLERIGAALFGEWVISPSLSGALARGLRDEARGQHRQAASLTEREGAILGALARGLSNKLIARELDITEGTVKVHVRNLLKKLDFRSRLEAAVWAVEHGYKGD